MGSMQATRSSSERPPDKNVSVSASRTSPAMYDNQTRHEHANQHDLQTAQPNTKRMRLQSSLIEGESTCAIGSDDTASHVNVQATEVSSSNLRVVSNVAHQPQAQLP